ncbi:MAG: hypothetical protein PUB21_08110 [Bacteroidales bacterium]|nr:hypothetical protein [Bacteroidales bacterium]
MKNNLSKDDYRQKCKHYLPMSEGCSKKSGEVKTILGVVHISRMCDGKCERMKRYNKKGGEQ